MQGRDKAAAISLGLSEINWHLNEAGSDKDLALCADAGYIRTGLLEKDFPKDSRLGKYLLDLGWFVCHWDRDWVIDTAP